MAEAVLMCEIEKLRSLLFDRFTNRFIKQLKEELINEMEMLAIAVREKKLEDGSRRLKCLISEIVERNAYHLLKMNNILKAKSFKSELKNINDILGEGARSQNDSVGGEVVGLEGDVKCFLREINSMDLSLQRKPFGAQIEGFVGSGKTTLARQLFHHAEVVQNFELRVWVDCTNILCLKELLINLIQQLKYDDHEDVEKMENAKLLEKLNHQLHRKRFFIVLDHGMSLMCRNFFSSLSGEAKTRSMVLLTLRDFHLYSFTNYQHEMKPLDVDKSWELLLKTMFSGINKFPKHIQRKAKAMLMKHSGGLPMAIKEVAMEWAQKQKMGVELEDIVKSEDLRLSASLEALESTIYHRLHPNEKLFFIHLGFFKLGTVIRANRINNTLLASGIVASIRNDTLRMKQVITIKYNSKSYKGKYVHVNSISHKLAIKKLKTCDEGASYRAIYCSRERFNCLTDKNGRLLCISFNGGGCFDTSPSYWKCFKQLRVLDFEDFGLILLPEIVGELIELRYLGLRNSYIEELPHSLRNLKNLQVLDIALNFMVKVPNIIGEMDALVHLYMSDIVCMTPLKIEALKNLETLTYISLDNWRYQVSGLQMMTNLNKLGIEGLDGNSDVSKLFVSLAELEKLNCLVLRGFRFRSMPMLDELCLLRGLKELKLDGLINMLPSPVNFPPKLSYLTLVNTYLDDDPMPALERLKFLTYLKLENAYTGQQLVISEDGFLSLYQMFIRELWQLRNIQVQQGGLKLLNQLEIYRCPFLNSLPKEITLKRNVVTTIK